MSELFAVIHCPRCGQRLRVPAVRKVLLVNCPCGHSFDWFAAGEARASEEDFESLSRIPPPRPAGWLRRNRMDFAVILGVVAVIGLAGLFGSSGGGSRTPVSRSARGNVLLTVVPTAISYGGLVDQSELTQSGESLGEVLGRRCATEADRSQLEPVLEPFARLLPDALDLIRGPGERPLMLVDEAFAPGDEQPAWVALLRCGRYVVVWDGGTRVTVFAPGRDPKLAAEAARGVLRHPLRELAEAPGEPLTVELFAYENRFGDCRLLLYPNSVELSDDYLLPAPGRSPPDLAGFDALLGSGRALSGARIEPGEGLVLVAGNGAPFEMLGEPVTVADLAAVYRAVFHSGSNEAYVSLDPSPDPTRVRVNFGGLLEDTRVGSVVLTADMRFKTLSCGLDPVTFADLRSDIRRTIPSFRTTSERDVESVSDRSRGWQGTRFWFYPDKVTVDTDPGATAACIRSARFSADAERSRQDFADPREFERHKAALLSPAVRANIDHLNADYDRYASLFGELADLDTVARLMALGVWLRDAATGDIDLDSLLAVNLPAWSTPREKDQLIVVTSQAHIRGSAARPLGEPTEASVWRLDPLLGKRPNEVFRKLGEIMEFQRKLSGRINPFGERTCRELISTPEDLMAFAEIVASQAESRTPSPLGRIDRELVSKRTSIENLERELDALKTRMALSVELHNLLVDRHNALVLRYGCEVDEYNSLVAARNALDVEVMTMTLIQGGISLSPREFKVRRSAVTPELARIRSAATSDVRASGWVRNPRSLAPSRHSPPTGKYTRPELERSSGADGALVQEGRSGVHPFRSVRHPGSGRWSDRVMKRGGVRRERSFDPAGERLTIREFVESKEVRRIVVEKVRDEIVFRVADAEVGSDPAGAGGSKPR